MGDPEHLPHPVRLFGRCIAFIDKHIRRKKASAGEELLLGTLLAAGLPSVVALLTSRTLSVIQPGTFNAAVEIALAASCLATHNLLKEASSVVAALEAHDLPNARVRLARIVGRDTDQLDAADISRGLIETLAESLCDGVLAPLFYLALGGVPAALAYKAINTMDSMIGHTTEQYWFFGKAAARIDDVANFIPARAGAMLLCASAALIPGSEGIKAAWITWHNDRYKHASPNAGQVESAMSGALGVRLGGASFYSGRQVNSPNIGQQYRAPDVRDAQLALRLTAVASLLGFGVAMVCLRKRNQVAAQV